MDVMLNYWADGKKYVAGIESIGRTYPIQRMRLTYNVGKGEQVRYLLVFFSAEGEQCYYSKKEISKTAQAVLSKCFSFYRWKKVDKFNDIYPFQFAPELKHWHGGIPKVSKGNNVFNIDYSVFDDAEVLAVWLTKVKIKVLKTGRECIISKRNILHSNPLEEGHRIRADRNYFE
jgi:hypothetical protein